MFGIQRRLAAAAVMAALLIGCLAHGSGSGIDLDWQTRHEQDSVLVVGSSPLAVTAAIRSRMGFDGDFGWVSKASASRSGGLVVILVSGLGAVAAVWWYLLCRDRKSARPLRRSVRPALRGPPAPVTV